MLCSRFLQRRSTSAQHGRLYRVVERVFDGMLHGLYEREPRLVARAIARSSSLVVARGARRRRLCCSCAIPKGFLPSEDTGQIVAYHRGRRRASPSTRWSRHQQAAAAVVARGSQCGRLHVLGRRAAAARRPAIRASSSCRLKPRDERKLRPTRSSRSCGRKLAQIPGMQRLPAESRRSSASAASSPRASISTPCRAPDLHELYARRAASSRTKLRDDRPACRTSPATCRSTSPQVNVDIDRDQAAALGVTAAADRGRALHRLRLAADLDHLHADQPVLGDPGAASRSISAIPRRSRLLYVRADRRHAGAARRGGQARAAPSARSPSTTWASCPPSPSPSTCAGRLAGRGGRRRSSRLAREHAAGHASARSFQGTAQAFQVSLSGLGLLLVMAVLVDLYRAGHSVRELHPPAHDSLRPALGRLRRAARRSMLFEHGAQPLRASSASSC